MGCEAHPDGAGRAFECSGNLEVVYSPYFVADKEYPHWNGAEAFVPQGEGVETYSMPTNEARLTETPGIMIPAKEIAVDGLRSVAA